MVLTNIIANRRREQTCIGITAERKYFRAGKSFIKRSLRPSEWQVSPVKGTIHVPRQGNERLLNEAAVLQFIQQKTNIPVPELYCCFEDDEAVLLITEYVEGVGMDSLNDIQQSLVKKELDAHLATLRSLRSSVIGGPTGIIAPPYRATLKTFKETWELRPSEHEDLVFCHNDLSQQNVIVDPKSFKINAIIDWEYAGFYPEYFEMRFFERNGPSVAIDGEIDDSMRLVEFLQAQAVCFPERSPRT